MIEIQTFDHDKKIVYDFYCENGKIKRICGWKYSSSDVIFNEFRNPEKYFVEVAPINMENFKKAVEVLCKDENISREGLAKFIKSIEKDDIYLPVVKLIINEKLVFMSEQVVKLGAALLVGNDFYTLEKDD